MERRSKKINSDPDRIIKIERINELFDHDLSILEMNEKAAFEILWAYLAVSNCDETGWIKFNNGVRIVSKKEWDKHIGENKNG